jgi:hypothetical protein
LEEHQILLCLQEVDLEVQEAILADEQARGQHPPDGCDQSVELEETPMRMDEINDKCTVEAG